MKKGSALLIVLGMIAFMLFSGIAFSVYMRQTRLPSTFLRRTTVTRQLAKAALAEAMTDIDYHIGHNPHPNIHAQSSNNNNQNNDETSNDRGNYWNHRVLVRNRLYANNDNGYTGGDTISTLTLEGLAYLPPSLINEARYYSRHTPTAKWQRFRFDAGRYAYCAIDVSDYFDVNRVLMDYPRSSSSSRRITLSHIFEQNGNGGLHGKDGGGEAAAWDEWLEESGGIRKVNDDDTITFDGKMPLVSLADFNLLLGGESFGCVKSPFVKYLDSSGALFYPGASTDENDAQAEAYRSMTFVTDSLFRAPTSDELDLEQADNQPFAPADLRKNVRMSLSTLQQRMSGRPRLDSYFQLLSRIGMATLYDYLDENSLPISLTVPSVERNPMICAVRAGFNNVSLSVKKVPEALKNAAGNGNPSVTPPTREVSMTVKYVINGGELGMAFAGGSVNGLALYPFLHGENPGSYSLDGKLALYLSRENEKLPLAGNNVNANFVFGKNGGADPESDVALYSNSGLIVIPLQGGLNAPSSVKTENDALVPFSARPNQATQLRNLLGDGRPWMTFTYKWTQTFTPPDGVDADPRDDTYWLPQASAPGVMTWNNVVQDRSSCRWPPLDANGEPVTDLRTIHDFITAGKQFHLNVAVWLRVKGSDGTVDMVPACLYDDKEQGISTVNPNAIRLDQYLKNYYGLIEGSGRHIMRFDLTDGTGGGFSLNNLSTDYKTLTLEIKPKQVMVADPRYNHNPNNWFSIDDVDDLRTAWLNPAYNPYAARDGDIFMSVSDQGYLQSIYELGFLPRLTNPPLRGQDPVGANLRALDATRTVFPGSFGDTQQRDLMWRTYRVFGQDADPLYEPGFVSGLRGLKVNPYSDSLEVLAAAFANTPVDWAHASTNVTANPHCEDDVDTFNKKYAWNAYNTGTTKLMWNDLQDLANAYYDKVRTGSYAQGDWEGAFEDLPWSSDPRRLLNGGEELDSSSSSMYSVDKKFLYGFWHDCFAANQQLFLVFVRAEPMMMGGGVAGNAPPQLSSRAVALVWRDPEARRNAANRANPGSEDYVPHAMRVLFYHPLD